MKKKVMTGVLLLASAGAVLLAGCKKEEEKTPEEAPAVKITQQEKADIELFRSLIGSIEPADQVYVIPKAAGEITAVYVKAGDHVEAGQVLCEIDTKQVESARLSMEAAQISLQDANTNLERMKVLYSTGDISSQAYEQVVSAQKGAQIQYDGAKLAYDYQVEFSTITATIAGTIESCSMEVHNTASSASALCVISGDGAKNISFSVTEAILPNLHEGDSIRIEKNGSEYKAVITDINTMVDAATGLFKVKAVISDAKGLASGASAKLYVTSDKATGVMTLPTDCVYYSNGQAHVYTYDAGTVHDVYIETGIADDDRIEIVSGLDADAQVITTWSSELYEGSAVILADDSAAAAN